MISCTSIRYRYVHLFCISLKLTLRACRHDDRTALLLVKSSNVNKYRQCESVEAIKTKQQNKNETKTSPNTAVHQFLLNDWRGTKGHFANRKNRGENEQSTQSERYLLFRCIFTHIHNTYEHTIDSYKKREQIQAKIKTNQKESNSFCAWMTICSSRAMVIMPTFQTQFFNFASFPNYSGARASETDNTRSRTRSRSHSRSRSRSRSSASSSSSSSSSSEHHTKFKSHPSRWDSQKLESNSCSTSNGTSDRTNVEKGKRSIQTHSAASQTQFVQFFQAPIV